MSIEEELAIARDVVDMTKTRGWNIIKEELQERIDSAIRELGRIRIEKRGLQDIAAEYIKYVERINGYQEIFNIIDDIMIRKENAESVIINK